MTPEEEVEKEPCPQCQGEGKVVIGEHRVTREMAIDAGDRSMEGAFHSYKYAPCEACDGEGFRDSYRSLESRLRKIAEENERLRGAIVRADKLAALVREYYGTIGGLLPVEKKILSLASPKEKG